MSDNVTINGVTIAAEDVASIFYQRWKIVDGRAAGTAGVPGSAANGLWVDDRASVSSVTTTSVDMSAGTVQTLAASNSARRQLTVANRSAVNYLFLKCGSAASLSSYGVPLPPLTYYELPFNYTGIVTAILAAAEASVVAVVQEF